MHALSGSLKLSTAVAVAGVVVAVTLIGPLRQRHDAPERPPSPPPKPLEHLSASRTGVSRKPAVFHVKARAWVGRLDGCCPPGVGPM